MPFSNHKPKYLILSVSDVEEVMEMLLKFNAY